MSENTNAGGGETFDLYSALAWIDRKAYAPLPLEDKAAFRFLRQFVGAGILQAGSDAALSAQSTGSGGVAAEPVAEWRLVPVEPTEAMSEAFERAYDRKYADIYAPTPTEHPNDGGGPFGYGYRAMLAAAPSPDQNRGEPDQGGANTEAGR